MEAFMIHEFAMPVSGFVSTANKYSKDWHEETIQFGGVNTFDLCCENFPLELFERFNLESIKDKEIFLIQKVAEYYEIPVLKLFEALMDRLKCKQELWDDFKRFMIMQN